MGCALHGDGKYPVVAFFSSSPPSKSLAIKATSEALFANMSRSLRSARESTCKINVKIGLERG
jgi:hypothetical protein